MSAARGLFDQLQVSLVGDGEALINLVLVASEDLRSTTSQKCAAVPRRARI